MFGSKHRSNVQGNEEIVEVGNKHGNGDEFLDCADFFFGIKKVRVGRSTGNTHIFFWPYNS